MTHADLIRIAGVWLRSRRRLTIVLEDFRCNSTSEQPDAIGWNAGGWSVLVECKASRADFLRDRKKWSRRKPDAMGQERFYLAPIGIISIAELPEGWGLLAPTPRGSVRVVHPAPHDLWHRERMREELPMVLSALRRAMKFNGSLAYPPPAPEAVEARKQRREAEKGRRLAAQQSLERYAASSAAGAVVERRSQCR